MGVIAVSFDMKSADLDLKKWTGRVVMENYESISIILQSIITFDLFFLFIFKAFSFYDWFIHISLLLYWKINSLCTTLCKLCGVFHFIVQMDAVRPQSNPMLLYPCPTQSIYSRENTNPWQRAFSLFTTKNKTPYSEHKQRPPTYAVIFTNYWNFLHTHIFLKSHTVYSGQSMWHTTRSGSWYVLE